MKVYYVNGKAGFTIEPAAYGYYPDIIDPDEKILNAYQFQAGDSDELPRTSSGEIIFVRGDAKFARRAIRTEARRYAAAATAVGQLCSSPQDPREIAERDMSQHPATERAEQDRMFAILQVQLLQDVVALGYLGLEINSAIKSRR
jgi:hypothetical protein